MQFLQSIGRWFATFGKSPADFINAGNAHYSRQDYDRAIADYSEAIRIEPTNAGALTNRGTAWYCKQEYDRAIADFSRAIEVDPKFLGAYSNRGSAWLAKQEFDRAIADFTAALEIDPNDTLSYLNRGTAWYYKQERDQSVDGAYQLDRPTVRRNDRLGYENALDDFYEATRLEPNNAWAFCARGATRHCLDEYDKAIDDYSQAIRLAPTLVLAYVNRGHAFRDKQAYRSAIADFEQAMRIEPNNVWSINGLAWLLGSALDDTVRDGKRAVELARKAFALDWTFPAAWLDTMAVAHAETGNFAEAVRCQEQALQTAPPGFEAEMRERLELYRKQQPYRQQKKRLLVTQFMPAKMR